VEAPAALAVQVAHETDEATKESVRPRSVSAGHIGGNPVGVMLCEPHACLPRARLQIRHAAEGDVTGAASDIGDMAKNAAKVQECKASLVNLQSNPCLPCLTP
jgi:hypothetical protein